jgi:hypothetical protein
MPAWFLRLCDIGLAISKLAEAERNAMNHRWKVAVDLDEENRVVAIQGMRQTAMRRAGNPDEAKYHERAQARAQAKADALVRELRKVDRHQVYHRAYQNLEAILNATKSTTALIRTSKPFSRQEKAPDRSRGPAAGGGETRY